MIDLHVHTTSSDGTYSPRQVVRLAAKRNITALAITDHDTVDGVTAAVDEGNNQGVEVISGVELSAQSDFGILHILGYFVSPDHPELIKKLSTLKQLRDDRTAKILEKLADRGIHIPIEEVNEEAGEGVTGRPHIARAMLTRGLVSHLQEAFDRYLKKGATCYVAKAKLPAEEAIQLIKGSGGLAVLAHPYSMFDRGPDELERLLKTLILQGLDGVEVLYPRHSREQTKFFRKLAQKYQLVETGGTDFHGDNKPDIQLGFVPGHPPLPYSIVENLKDRHALTSSSALEPSSQDHVTCERFGTTPV